MAATVKVCDPYCVDCNGTGGFPGYPGTPCPCVTYVAPERVDGLMFRAVSEK